ncbi:MAG TPA: hypothetical protein VG713_19140, partial [Pirellulales bacterium]|nr:hypothetical protein [Pirellulales bacterium]
DFAIPKSKLQPKKIELAEMLINAASEAKFDIGDYTDRYQQRVHELIEMKKRGQEIVRPEEPEEPRVINLMEALRQSVAKAKGERPKRAKAHGKKASHPPARRRKRA